MALFLADRTRRYADRKPRPIIGLARNPDGIEFRCGKCEYFEDGTCHNPEPRLNEKKVDPIHECCDLFDHPGMKVLIK